MNYIVKSPILGLENIQNVKLEKVDEMFVTISDCENEKISLTLVNPYALREYSFDIPLSTKALLDINEKTNISVYNVVVIQNPINNSRVNFLAPLLFNEDNKTVCQILLKPNLYPDFEVAQSISLFIKE